MGFKFKKDYLGLVLLCLILFGNFWIWKAFSFSFPIFLLLVGASVLAYRFIKSKGKLLGFLFFFVLIVFSQWKTTSPASLTVLLNDDIRLRDQRLKEYPPVFIKVGSKTVWIPVAHWFEGRKETIAVFRLANNLSEVIDPNLYFFANHPRERVGVSEFEKFPFILFPFFFVGVLTTVGLKRLRPYFLSLIITILLLSLFGNKNRLGPFALIPFIVSLSAIGGEYLIKKTLVFISRLK